VEGDELVSRMHGHSNDIFGEAGFSSGGWLNDVTRNGERLGNLLLYGDEDIYRAIRAGAKGYLLKDITREALMDSIRRVHMGETCVSLHLIAELTDRVSGETLSERELEVLRLMAKGRSNKEIASALFISEGTVKSHGKSIFAKLNVASRTEAVTEATRRGFLRL
jgi:two-component system NarL family response regulator